MKNLKSIPATLLGLSFLLLMNAPAAESATGNGINQFGLDLHRRLAADGGNVVFSPWSIQSALAMTYAGADGTTKEQMAATLHFPMDDAPLHSGIAGIAADLAKLAAVSRELVKRSEEYGGPKTALEIQNANRLFGQQRYAFEKSFLEITAKTSEHLTSCDLMLDSS
jgi:serpin B